MDNSSVRTINPWVQDPAIPPLNSNKTKMKFFKPFTPSYDKKEIRGDFRYNKMKELAEINGKEVYLKEKYGRMDYSFYGGVSNILDETMQDYETMSEESCMYCNRYCKQHWTHEDSWLIHLCLPCLIGDKITILLENIIRRWRKIMKGGGNGSLSYSV